MADDFLSMDMEDDFLTINVEYKFSSGIHAPEASDCITEYKAVLYAGEYADNSFNEYAGEMDFKIISLGQAEAEGFNIYEMFDTYEYTFRHSQGFYDFGKRTFKKPVLKEFPDLEFDCSRLCIIETIGIIPKFRGKGIGAKVFKDLVWRFDNCELFILQPYPLQFEHPKNKKALLPKLDLGKFEKNKKVATKSLSNYYQSWGFKKIKGMKELLFYCPMYRNEAFDNIDMDDY
ncbi:hypothetical protein [Chitinophaga flava]|uniref:Uncharacterized protein n=1 Tax=Chitinophaga flava TaxID=2259036 RepID=A0A365XTM5_9BACT|nr:hypothetical protein [Chitinophaga flava]RBL89727.1 hypothetical protein DF182_24860 [Chitinophaga flava]